MPARAAVIRRLNWGWRIDFQAHSAAIVRPPVFARSWSKVSAFYTSLSIRLLMAWWLSSPRMNDPRKRMYATKMEAMVSFIIESWKRHTITFAICYWLHRPSLVQCGRGIQKRMNTRRYGSWEPSGSWLQVPRTVPGTQ